MEVVVVSNDKDLMQLVTPQVTFYDAAKDRRLDPDGVTAHMGVRPEQIPDFLGLQGDAVDNIPGVKGIGARTALALLQVFPNLEALYANLAQLATLPIRNSKTLRQKLEAGQESAFLCRRLATIALDAPVTYTSDAFRYQGAPAPAATALLAELGLQRLARP
jgi:DNA polymerase-1